MNLNQCRTCQSKDVEMVHQLNQLPIRVWPLPEKYPQGHQFEDAGIFVCKNCDHIQLQDLSPEFVASLYDEGSFLENDDPLKKIRLEEILKTLGADYFNNKKVLDVGGGNNPFVDFLPASSENWVADIDPTPEVYDKAHKVIKGEFENTSISEKFDVILSFHSLEHFLDPYGVVKKMSEVLKNDGKIIVEVPHFKQVIEQIPFYAVFHQHLSMFSLSSLDKVFELNGCGRSHLIRQDEVLLAVYELGRKTEEGVFKGNSSKLVGRLRDNLTHLDAQLKSLTQGLEGLGFYGAGGSTSLFLSHFPWLRDKIHYSFDRDERKQDRFIPGTMVQVGAPSKIDESGAKNLLFLSDNVCGAVSKTTTANCISLSPLLKFETSEKKVQEGPSPCLHS